MTNAELGIPEYKIRKKSVSTYKKTKSIKDFQEEYQEWFYKDKPLFEKNYQVRFKFSDKTANELTKLIKSWFQVNGGFAQRVNSGATYDPRIKRFRKGSGSTVGAADIMATFKGKAVHIEVKIGKDKQRKEQIEFQRSVEEAGGIYFIAKTFDNFLEQIYSLLKI